MGERRCTWVICITATAISEQNVFFPSYWLIRAAVSIRQHSGCQGTILSVARHVQLGRKKWTECQRITQCENIDAHAQYVHTKTHTHTHRGQTAYHALKIFNCILLFVPIGDPRKFDPTFKGPIHNRWRWHPPSPILCCYNILPFLFCVIDCNYLSTNISICTKRLSLQGLHRCLMLYPLHPGHFGLLCCGYFG